MIKSILLAGASALAFSSAAEAVTFGYTGSVETWTVPTTGVYQITAWGSQGGWAGIPSQLTFRQRGGYGAEVGGDLQLTAGTTLNLVVGGMGTQPGETAYGGGGGSWVFTDKPLVIAGGGAGAYFAGNPSNTGCCILPPAAPGLATRNGGGKTGGVGGNGGGGGGFGGGGGGGGWKSDGAPGVAQGSFQTYSDGGHGPPSFSGGAYGYFSLFPSYKTGHVVSGGFGGGGAAGYGTGGGGGGYSGGEGGYGGGSYLADWATHAILVSGENAGDGQITINLLSGVPEPSTWSLSITGFGFLGYVLRRRRGWKLRRV